MAGMLLLEAVLCLFVGRSLPLSAALFATTALLLLGGCLWWVARRLFGTRGGYTALGFFVFSPLVRAAVYCHWQDLLAAVGLFGGVYTCIGVAHAMQGPIRKWPPRLILLTAAFTVTAFMHPVAFVLMALLGLGLMCWVAEFRRGMVMLLGFAAFSFAALLGMLVHAVLPGIFGGALSWPRLGWFALGDLFYTYAWTSLVLIFVLVLVLLAIDHRARYFGNLAPLLCAAVLLGLEFPTAPGMGALWATPFLLTGAAGVLADGYELKRGRVVECVALYGVVCGIVTDLLHWWKG